MQIDPRIDLAIDKMQKLSQDTSELRPRHGPCAVFHYVGHAIERFRDVGLVFGRMTYNRAVLKAWFAGGRQDPQGDPSHALKLDFESLYLFGNVLLDQLFYAYGYLVGDSKPEEGTFSNIVKSMAEGRYTGNLGFLWAELSDPMLWLHLQVTLHRNKLIAHANRPWQRGHTCSIAHDDFQLFIPAPYGWLDTDAVEREILSLIHLAPQHIKDASQDDPIRPRGLLECLISRIGKIADEADRERVRALTYKYGFSTPTFQQIAGTLLDFANQSIQLVHAHVLDHPDAITLGEFKHVKPLVPPQAAQLQPDKVRSESSR